MRLSPHSSPIWDFMPSSSVAYNIYKPLKRINLQATSRAVFPISSSGPSGLVTVDLMDLCGGGGFQSCCSGTRPLAEWTPSSLVQRRTVTPGLSWDSTSHKHQDVSLPLCWRYNHLIYCRSWLRKSLRLNRLLRGSSCVCCMMLLSSPSAGHRRWLCWLYSCLFNAAAA